MGNQGKPSARSAAAEEQVRVDKREKEREARRLVFKALFIEAVAEYLTTNVAHKSMLLQLGKPEGREWGLIAHAIPGGNGYDDKAKRIEQLTDLLR